MNTFEANVAPGVVLETVPLLDEVLKGPKVAETAEGDGLTACCGDMAIANHYGAARGKDMFPDLSPVCY